MKLFDWQRSLDLLEQMRLRLVRSDSSSYIANLNAADPEIKLSGWYRYAIMAAGELVFFNVFMCVHVVDIDVIFCRYWFHIFYSIILIHSWWTKMFNTAVAHSTIHHYPTRKQSPGRSSSNWWPDKNFTTSWPWRMRSSVPWQILGCFHLQLSLIDFEWVKFYSHRHITYY